MTRTIKVFPDYCSTGLWENQISVDVEQFDWLPFSATMALRYWHRAWEMLYDYESCKWMGSTSYYKEWYEDGKELVNIMNEYCHYHGIEFTYAAETPEELFGG